MQLIGMGGHRVSRVRPDSGPLAAGGAAGPATLADLRPGMRCRVVGIDQAVDARTVRRLHDLGFAPDAEVTVLRRAPLGDPVVFEVCGYEIALRTSQAGSIDVRPMP